MAEEMWFTSQQGTLELTRHLFSVGNYIFFPGSIAARLWSWSLRVNFIWRSTFFYKEFYNRTILNFIHFKGYTQHSCFTQLYKTNYLIEWLAISHGYLWQMYQLRGKTLADSVAISGRGRNFQTTHVQQNSWQEEWRAMAVSYVRTDSFLFLTYITVWQNRK
jgi:hypothetical protein